MFSASMLQNNAPCSMASSSATWVCGSASNQVLTLAVASGAVHRESTKAYDHYSLLATIEDLLGVGRLGRAAQAQPMTDLVG